MKKKQPDPLLPIIEYSETKDFYLEDEEIFEQAFFTETDASYDACTGLILKQCHLKKVTMQKTRLEHWECQNVFFENCDFSNMECLGASFHQVHFKNCKLTGTNFAESYFRDCTFESCVGNFASFSNTNLKTIRFAECQLNDTEFYEVQWKNLQLPHNQLTNSNWFRTKLYQLDLRTNPFQKIALSQELLRGLIVDQEQALVIAAGLGLVID
ncbi:MAG: pentapeptide repeat-containing protein [Enterococcus gallinarum]|nr:pentapeptide repeat-containing protein [Enterococcus gallinarum]